MDTAFIIVRVFPLPRLVRHPQMLGDVADFWAGTDWSVPLLLFLVGMIAITALLVVLFPPVYFIRGIVTAIRTRGRKGFPTIAVSVWFGSVVTFAGGMAFGIAPNAQDGGWMPAVLSATFLLENGSFEVLYPSLHLAAVIAFILWIASGVAIIGLAVMAQLRRTRPLRIEADPALSREER